MFTPAPLVGFGGEQLYAASTSESVLLLFLFFFFKSRFARVAQNFAASQDKLVTLRARTRHPVRGKVVVNDLVLQVDGGHVLRVGHGHGEQDAHEQVDHLERQAKGGGFS